MSRNNQEWRLARHPVGMVEESDFSLHDVPVPSLREGQILVEVSYLSVDPAMRTWITGRDTYTRGVQVGDTMRGMGTGIVVESRNAELPVGTAVVAGTGWRRFAVVGPEGEVPPRQVPQGIPLTMPLSVLGITGLTAYFGLLDIGAPEAGHTVLVSGAAGATGSVAAQIAKLKGCRVIGVAGGPDKCAWLTDELGLDGAIDYKADDLAEAVRTLCPDGVNVFFDNVGGEILDVALANLALRGRVVVCGGISRYNEKKQPPGPSNYLNLIVKRGRMEGFVVIDYAPRFREAVMQLAAWVGAGRIKYRVDVLDGFENLPRALQRLFTGANHGKQLVSV